MALHRMLSYRADAGLWAIAMPPYSLTPWRPRVPSVPVPESMDAHGVRALVSGQRAEESVNGRAMAAGLLGRRLYAQDAAGAGQGGLRWDHVDMVGLNRRGRRHLPHGHPGVL